MLVVWSNEAPGESDYVAHYGTIAPGFQAWVSNSTDPAFAQRKVQTA